MDSRFEIFTVLITRISRSIKRIKAEEMASFQLKGPHVSCLFYLYRCGPMTAAELCDRCDEDKAAISRSLDYLEKNGYLYTDTKSGKKYKSLITLTDKGSAMGQNICRKIDGILDIAGQSLSDGDREIMYRALEQISEQLEEICRHLVEKNHENKE